MVALSDGQRLSPAAQRRSQIRLDYEWVIALPRLSKNPQFWTFNSHYRGVHLEFPLLIRKSTTSSMAQACGEPHDERMYSSSKRKRRHPVTMRRYSNSLDRRSKIGMNLTQIQDHKLKVQALSHWLQNNGRVTGWQPFYLDGSW